MKKIVRWKLYKNIWRQNYKVIWPGYMMAGWVTASVSKTKCPPLAVGWIVQR